MLFGTIAGASSDRRAPLVASSCVLRRPVSALIVVPAPNKQFEPTVTRRRVRAASAPFHYALAASWTRGRAAAQLRR